jgi:hypothetical protein
MLKNILIIITIVLFSLAIRTNALSNSAYELEPKYLDHYTFSQPIERLKEKDFYDQYYKENISSAIAGLINNKYEYKLVDNRRIVTAKNEFELNYFLSPIDKNPTNKEFYNCYKGIDIELIDNRFYSIPMLTNDELYKSLTPVTLPRIVPNQFRIIPQYAVLRDYPINEPETNYNFFKFENDELKTITNKSEISNQTFNFCLETASGKYTNGNREGIDMIYSIVNPQDKTTVFNVIKRSVIGSQDKPSVDVDIENRRIVALKNPNPPKDPNKTNNLFIFLFYGIPLIAIIYFVFKLIIKVRDR